MKKRNKKEKEETKELSHEEVIKKENKGLRNILIGIIGIIAAIFLFMFLLNYFSSFSYHGVKFDIVKFCDSGPPCLVTYRTSLPVRPNGGSYVVVKPADKTNDYNFYLRNDPRKLNVGFNGTISIKSNVVFNSQDNFTCNGNGIVAGQNFVQLYQLLGSKVIRDENATCDTLGRYMYVRVQSGNQTSIEQFGSACYNINIKDCEILNGMEKFMIDTFVKVNDILNNKTA